MSTTEFDIVFRGDLVLGHQLGDVKQRLQQLFKTDATKVDALFTGRPVPLKRNLDEATANKYRDVLLKAGAQVEVKPSGSVNFAPPQPIERPEPVRRNVWSLAPVGASLLAPAERPKLSPVVVDTSQISLRPAEGNLLDVTEVKGDVVPSVVAPNIGLAEVGENLLRDDEHMALPLLEIEIEDWGIAEIGADLIAAEDRPHPVVPEIAVGEYGLAPAGSDLGQLKPNVKPVTPDISGISLAD
jgi:hypothetical protein